LRRVLPILIALILLTSLAAVAWTSDPPPLFYAVIADTQKGDDDPFADFGWAIDQVNGLQPEFVLMPGDLTNTGTDNQYANFMKVASRCQVPIHFCVGNHGAVPGQAEYRDRFTRYTGQPTWYHQAVGGWHLFVMDSPRFVDGELQHDGEIDREQLDWLASELTNVGPREPVFLAEHHPISVKADGLQNADDLMALLDDRYLAYTVTAHFHRNRHDVDQRGVHHLITGSLSFSTSPAACGIGYRLMSTVGRDLWTAWVETDDEAPLVAWHQAAGPGELQGKWRMELPTAPPHAGQVAIRVRYAGDGLSVKSGAGAAIEFPATPAAATALVIASPTQSRRMLRASTPIVSVEPLGDASLESVAVYLTSAQWEHFELRPLP